MTVTITKTISLEAVEDTKKKADELRATADRAKTVAANAKQHLDALTVEAAAIPSLKVESILSGDVGAYANVLDRERILPAEQTIAAIAAARASVEYWEAETAWARSYREWASMNSQRIGKNSGYQEGLAAGNRADGEYQNARSIVSTMSQGLGDAQRHLARLIEEATAVNRR